MNDGVSAISSNSLEDYESQSAKTQSVQETYVEKPTKPAYYQHEIEEEKPKAVENLFSDISCCCFPTCASSPTSILSRTWLWFLANSDQFMSSIIVAVSLIPEAISYGVMAGLGPRAALQSCWIANMATSLVGGRPGMISGASGLMALVLSRLVQTGVEDDAGNMISGITFVPYAIGFAGILQSVSSIFGLGRLATSFPAPVVVGMVNAVAILTLAMQCRYAKEYAWSEEALAEKVSAGDSAVNIEWNIALFEYFGEGFDWITPYINLGVYGAEVALSLAVCALMPKVTTVFPATLFSILLVVAVEFGLARQLGVETPLIRDYGGAQVVNPLESIFSSELYSSNLPSLASLENWKLIAGYGGALFATTFTETAIALNVVDRLDETQGPGAMVLIGQGFSNIVSAVMGGMGGSGVVTSSVLADRTFGTTCLSTFFTGFIVFVCIYWGYPIIDYIPLSAISGISISMVCSFIQWRSIVAIFATVLPDAKREGLPPQYNVARIDIFFMLFVTAACLILDVATLAIFVIAGFVYMYHAARSQCCGHTRSGPTNKRKFFTWRGKKDDTIQRSSSRSNMGGSRQSRGYYDEENSQYDEGIEVSPSGTIVGVDAAVDALNNLPSPAVAANTIMEKAENIIFPVNTTDSDHY